MSPGDGPDLRRLAIRVAIALKTGLGELESLPVPELLDIAQEVVDIYGSK